MFNFKSTNLNSYRPARFEWAHLHERLTVLFQYNCKAIDFISIIKPKT